ncbi:winged helix DNA-binding protein [Allonocardiopsis opalescens]|uniref:Winged helix DNA-binding protein n=1 Tax=Allonocardiopsis opalescens TaxID=1144618 RepID=A0A2T0QAL5_9ACTN|nr:winged helix DNA-binding protein [Allonocardiopsis opalescens]
MDRGRVIAYRALSMRDVLPTGAQDHPPGRTARLALRLRGIEPDDDPGGHALVQSVRGAIHLHAAADVDLYTAALRIEDGADIAPYSFGTFGRELSADGVRYDAALADVADAMRAAMAAGEPLTKGELSEAVTPAVPPRLAPWCGGCGVNHVHDGLFRAATLQAGLRIEVEHSTLFRYLPPTGEAGPPADPAPARAELVRRFLRAFGPARPVHLAGWLGLTPAAGRRWWALAEDELEEVRLGGHRHYVLADAAAALLDAPEPEGTRLLGPYDPVTELADRELLVPDRTRRGSVWNPAGNPGVLLVDGEIAGTWRQRSASGRLTLTVRPFDGLGARRRSEVEAEAEWVGAALGAERVAAAFG